MPISSDNEKRQNQIANLKPFKKLSECTPEELERQKDISLKGAIARTEKQREQKNLRETALTLLNTPISREKAQSYIGEKADLISDSDLTMQTVLTVRLMDALLQDGNCKAYELLRDTSGQKPVDISAVDISADIMTAADRQLLENINSRMFAGDGQKPENAGD